MSNFKVGCSPLTSRLFAGKQAIEELEKLFSNQEHGEREEIADVIIDFVENMKVKYGGE